MGGMMRPAGNEFRSPGRVFNQEEFDALKASVEALAGSTGVAEYYRILRQHGAERPRQFQSAQPARLCAKDVYILLEQLRANARENQADLPLAGEGEAVRVEAVGVATVGKRGDV